MNYIRLVIVSLIVGLNFLSCNINAEIPEVPNYEQNENPINEEPEPRHIKLISLGDSYTIGQSVC